MKIWSAMLSYLLAVASLSLSFKSLADKVGAVTGIYEDHSEPQCQKAHISYLIWFRQNYGLNLATFWFLNTAKSLTIAPKYIKLNLYSLKSFHCQDSARSIRGNVNNLWRMSTSVLHSRNKIKCFNVENNFDACVSVFIIV